MFLEELVFIVVFSVATSHVVIRLSLLKCYESKII